MLEVFLSSYMVTLDCNLPEGKDFCPFCLFEMPNYILVQDLAFANEEAVTQEIKMTCLRL